MATDRLSKLRGLDPIQTALGVGYKDPEFAGDILFPIVTVDQESGKFPQDNLDAFKTYNTLRQIKADSNVLPSSDVTLTDFRMDEYDAVAPLDYRENIAGQIFGAETRARIKAQKVVMRQKEIAQAALATTASNYASGHATALSGTSQWDQKTTSDPFDVVDAGRDKIRSKTGNYPNYMFIGIGPRLALKEHPDVIEKIKYSQRGVVTDEILAQAFDIPNVVTLGSLKSTDAGVLQNIWGKVVILAYVNPSAASANSLWEPSFGKTVRLNIAPFADQYDTQGGKVMNMRFTDIYDVLIQQNFAGYLIEDVIS